MSKGITQEAMLSVLPGVLARDDGMYSLAQLIGWIIDQNTGKIDSPAIFQNIDSLDEDLLDLLAKDYKIDWYDYDGTIETKRNQLKSNWFVRKKIGTVGAVKAAIRDVWPDSTVEEWYEYGGDPGYFQVLLSLNTEGTVPFNKAVRMVEVFKPVRAHIDGYPILRIRCGIVIKTKKSENIRYHVPQAGTVPRRSTHGDKSYEDIVIETRLDGSEYHVPVTGKSTAGTWPDYATHGNKSEEDIVLQTEADGPEYHVPITGQITAGTHPDYSTHGDVGAGGLEVSGSSVSVGYGIRRCGTPNNSLF